MENAEFEIPDAEEIPHVPCQMSSPLDLKSMLKNTYINNSFSLLSLNMRSIRKNFSSLLSFLSMIMFKFTIMILVETWLSEDIDIGFNIEGYKQLNIYRNAFGGGVKLYYDVMANAEIIESMTFVRDYMEVISINLFYNKDKYFVSGIYRPPSASPYLFNNALFQTIISDLPSSCLSLLVDDINLNLFNPQNCSYIDDFINLMFSYNYFPVITRPTRINENVNRVVPFSLVDQIWSNFNHGLCSMSAVVKSTISDHFPILYVFKLKTFNVVRTIKFRLIKERNVNNFVDLVTNLPLDTIYMNENIDGAFSDFYNKLFSIYNETCPVKKKAFKE